MLRRSVRLQEAGYYGMNGKPSVTYKETIKKVFQRRKRHGHHMGSIKHNWSMDPYEDVFVTSTVHHVDYSMDNYDYVCLSSNSHDDDVCDATLVTQANGIFKTKWSNLLRITGGLHLLLLLAFGLAHVSTEMRALQQEVKTLRERMDTVAPVADTIPNFALESMGARVSEQLSSETYQPTEKNWILKNLLNFLSPSTTIQTVIQGISSLKPGQGWCFPGSKGHLFVYLSHPISITHVTIGHITKSQSPYGHISSAPRTFSVSGMRSTEEEGTYLGTMTYDQEGAAFQTLELPKPDDTIFSCVRLEVENNWGKKNYTCLYSFRVHGKLWPLFHV